MKMTRISFLKLTNSFSQTNKIFLACLSHSKNTNFTSPFGGFMNKFIILFFILFSLLISQEVKEETFQFENLRVIKRPTTPPRAVISNDFIPANAVVIQSVELTNLASVIPESALFLESSLSVEELIQFYEKVLQARDWRILQKDSKGNKSVILGENPTKKVMTVLIRDDKDNRVVKIFYRRPGY
jgi:hypothetical protein